MIQNCSNLEIQDMWRNCGVKSPCVYCLEHVGKYWIQISLCDKLMQSILPCASPNVIYKSSIYRICGNFWSQICLCLVTSIEQMGKYWESNLPAWKLMHSSLPCWVVLVPLQTSSSSNWRPLRRQPREEQKGRAFIYVVCILYRVSHIEMDKVN